MEGHIGELSSVPLIIRGTAKIHAVSGHKGPVTLQEEGLQLPVFRSGLSHPDHMGTFSETTPLGDRNQIQGQAFINQEFHYALSPWLGGAKSLLRD